MIFLPCFFSLVVVNFNSGTKAIREELQLLKDLLKDYDTAARPVLNQSQVVQVKMGVALFQIRDLDEKNQFLQVNAWFQFVSFTFYCHLRVNFSP